MPVGRESGGVNWGSYRGVAGNVVGVVEVSWLVDGWWAKPEFVNHETFRDLTSHDLSTGREIFGGQKFRVFKCGYGSCMDFVFCSWFIASVVGAYRSGQKSAP